MEQKILLPRTSIPWTELMAIDIYYATIERQATRLFSEEIKPGIMSPYITELVVGPHGWLVYPHKTKTEIELQTQEYQRILQSGKKAKWFGQGPWTRGLYCRVPETYIGKHVYQIQFDFTDAFIEELRAEGIYRRKDVAVLLPHPYSKHLLHPYSRIDKLEQIPVQYASFYCPDWDDDHPIVLDWLKEWQEAVKLEEEFGINCMLDFI